MKRKILMGLLTSPYLASALERRKKKIEWKKEIKKGTSTTVYNPMMNMQLCLKGGL